MDLGKKLYGNNCANCHQASGEGQPGPILRSSAPNGCIGSKERLAAIMLAGVSGPITVKGATYGTQVMPGWARHFTDEKIADIMTYMRATWGNTAKPVKAEEVAAARTKFAAHLASPYYGGRPDEDRAARADPSDKK